MRAGDRLTGIDLGHRRADSTPPEKPVAGAPRHTPTTQNNHDDRVTHPASEDATRTQTERNQYDSDALPLFTQSQAVHISIMRCHSHRIKVSAVPDIPSDEYPTTKNTARTPESSNYYSSPSTGSYNPGIVGTPSSDIPRSNALKHQRSQSATTADTYPGPRYSTRLFTRLDTTVRLRYAFCQRRHLWHTQVRNPHPRR